MTEILEIFAKCTACGTSGAKIRKIEKWAKDNGIMYATHKTGSGNHEPSNIRHMQYLEKARLPLSHSIGIVVTDTHEITRLLDFVIPE